MLNTATNSSPVQSVILSNIHSSMNEIKEFAFNFLQSSNESELCNDEWLTFNPSIDINMHDMEGVISIQAYPVVDNNVVTSSMVHVAALPTYKLDFDALEYFGHSDYSELTPKEIAFTNVMEHITNEIELFKSMGTPIGLVTASELYAFYQTLIQKRSES